MAKHNRMQLVWVFGCMKIDVNEMQLDKAPHVHLQDLSQP
jgi:hypothetical protein